MSPRVPSSRAWTAARCPAAVALLLVTAGASFAGGADDGSRRTLHDDLDRPVAIAAVPQRIISLTPALTEILFALGRGEAVVGVTDFCDLPPEARRRPRIGGMVNPNWEAIASLRPDLVVASTSGNDAGIARQAEALGLSLYVADSPGLEPFLASLPRLGEAVGAGEAGARLARKFRDRLGAMRAASTVGPRILYLVWTDPPVVPGAGTFLNDLFDAVGLVSISREAPTGWPTYDLETILRQEPEWILTARHNSAAAAALATRPGWRGLKAVRAGRILLVEDTLERPSPSALDALEDALRRLRPEAKK